jgi:hypothetical protein
VLKRTITPSGFKAWCLAFLRVVPAGRVRNLRGSVEYLVSDEELVEPLYEDWEPTLEM